MQPGLLVLTFHFPGRIDGVSDIQKDNEYYDFVGYTKEYDFTAIVKVNLIFII